MLAHDRGTSEPGGRAVVFFGAMPDETPRKNPAPAGDSAGKRMAWGCAGGCALGVLIVALMAIVGLACPVSERGREPGRPSSSRPSAPDCTREYIVKEGAEDRLEALEDRAPGCHWPGAHAGPPRAGVRARRRSGGRASLANLYGPVAATAPGPARWRGLPSATATSWPSAPASATATHPPP